MLIHPVEEIRKALKAADLMKMLDGQKALGNKVGTKALGEHKVSSVPQVNVIVLADCDAVLEDTACSTIGLFRIIISTHGRGSYRRIETCQRCQAGAWIITGWFRVVCDGHQE